MEWPVYTLLSYLFTLKYTLMNQKTIAASVIGAVVIGIAILFFGFDDDSLPVSEQQYTVTTVASSTATDTASNQYTATIAYKVPSPEQNSITVAVTLANGIVTAVDAQNTANSGESEQYSKRFLASYKTQVIGKKLQDVSLSRIGGASLTSNAFNAAIDAIKVQVG